MVKTLKQTAYYVLDDPLVQHMYALVKSNLKEFKIGQMPALFKQQTQIYMYLSKVLEAEGSDTDFKIELINLLLKTS